MQSRSEMRLRRIAQGLIVLLVALLCSLPFWGGQSSTTSGDLNYDAVLDRLFPAVWQGSVPSNSRNVVLKFGGTYLDTEMEILIYGQDSKEERYEVWRVPNGKPSVLQQLMRLGPNVKKEDLETIASSITIEHRIIRHPSKEMTDIARQLSLPNFPLSVDDGITLDGISYNFYMRSISNNTHIELIGPNGPESRNPLIKWMTALRRAVEAQLDESGAESRPKGSDLK
jgi:hypothetical protein